MNSTKDKGRRMKESGVEWIGKIPENWEIERLKVILNERKENNNPIKTDFILSLTVDKGVIPYNEKTGGGNKAKEDLSAYKLAYPNDIILNSMNVLAGSVGISKYFGCVSPVYYMLYPRNLNSVEYYNNIFQTKEFQGSLLGLGNGIMMKESDSGKLNTIRMRIPMSKLNTVQLPVPPLEEQQKIANFLDQKVSEIDHILEKTKESIEEYKKYKQSIITEAVTKGLNPDVEMKDSGIEWIGDIPKEWEVTQLKRFSSICNGKEIKVEVDKNDKENSKIVSVYGSGGIFKYTNDFLHNGESVLFGRKGTIGKPMYVNERFWTVDTMYFMKFKSELEPKYCYYYLTFYPWDTIMTKTALPSVVGTDVGNSQFAFPSKEEQLQIISYLDDKCNEIDSLISQKEQLLSDLESYKKSLIYECVTGKRQIS